MKHLLEAFFLHIIMGIFAILPPAWASNVGAFITRTIGPRMGASRKARKNIALAFPEMTEYEIEKTLLGMWDNLGRVIAEYPHLETIGKSRTTIINDDILVKTIAAGNGGIFIAAHIGNWEVSAPSLLFKHNTLLHLTYRAANNIYADRMLEKLRTLKGRIPASPKARSSAWDIMQTLRDKKYLGILIDQKFNEGLAVPFFGVPAMTNPVFVTLAQKFKCDLIPAWTRRTGPAQFEITIYEPIKVFADDGTPLPPETVIASTHAMLESWIKKTPEQWLWMHKRWDSKGLAN